MKTRNVLTALVFVLGIGSAVASELFLSEPAFSKKADVEGQQANCQERGICTGTRWDCSINVDPDGSGPLPAVLTPMYEAGVTSCGARLKQD
jgi:hypothetical protein